jgi:YVTN family beta-propeller protein
MNCRRSLRLLAVCLSLCVSLASLAGAQTSTAAAATTASALPRLVRFGGVVKDLNGNPLNGVVGITFALYGEQTGGAPLWLETQNVTADGNGHYTALLGSTKPDGLPTELFTSEQARWVGVQVSGQAEQPRVLLVSAPYAFKAGDAETIGGLPPSAFVLAPAQASASVPTPVGAVSTAHANASAKSAPTNPNVTGAGTTGYVPLWDTSSDIVNSILFQTGSGSSALVGINTTKPADTLDVNGTVNAAKGFYLGHRQFAFGVFNSGNVFLGFSGSSASGSNNTAVGVNALLSDVNGQGNTATGWNALSTNNGNHNTATGDDSLHLNRTGNSNSGFGYAALATNNGSFNSALGAGAGTDSTTPSLMNATAIGAYADVAASNSLVLGSILNVNGCTSPTCASTNVGIGTTTPLFSLDVHGTGNFTGAVTFGSPVAFVTSQTFPNTISGVTTAYNSGLVGGGTTGKLNLSLINTCSLGQVLAWNGADSGGWLCTTVSGGGSGVTSVGGGLGVIASPNPITSTGTLSIDTTVLPQLGAANTFTGLLTAAGGAVLPPIGGTPATGGSPSNPLDLTASASDGSSNTNQTFRWQAMNVDGAMPSANLNLLFGSGSATPQPTGLSVAPNGIISFAPNQTFPGGGGSGITTVVAGTGLSGGGSTPTVTLNVNQGVVAFQSDLTNGINTAEAFATTAANTAQTTAENYANSTFVPLTAEGSFATLGANIFTGNQTVNGNLNLAAPGSSFQIGSIPFAFGAYGTQNAFLGFAGNSTMTGLYNTASGYQALLANTIGNGNTGNGDQALANNTSGSQNTASGGAALANNTMGFYNTATGYQALLANTIGSDNTASGFEALVFNTTGGGNTAVGYEAGDPTNSAMTTGANNTFVGYTANPGTQTNLNNATAIGAYAQVTNNNALVLGSILGTNGCSAPCGNTSVGIGTTAPGYPLDVNGVIRSSTGGFMFPDGSVQTKAASGGSGTVTSVGSGFGLTGGPINTSGSLTIDTSVVPQLTSSNIFNGSITASSFIGNGAQLTNVNAATLGGFSPGTFATLGANGFTGNQTITGMVGIGTATPKATLDVNGGINTATSFNIGGTPFAFGSAFNQNAFLGFAGNTTTTGQFNAGTGSQALYSNTSGSYNTASGEQALYSNTQGSSNTAAGNAALYSNVTGHDNTAAGNGALFQNTGSFNTVSGSLALGYNTSGNNNTASGYNSLSNNSTGSYNTAIGDLAGQSLDGSFISASNNTFLGAGSAVSTGTLNNATAIGSNSEVGKSNALVLGAITGVNGGTSVNVGIGTTAPQATLDVEAPNGTPQPTVLFGSASNPANFTVNGFTTSITSGTNNIAINNAGLQLTGTELSLNGPIVINGPTTQINGLTTIAGGLTVIGGCTGCGGSGGGSGTVTSVATGLGLTGGPITSSGTLSINTSVVPQLGAANTFSGNNTFSGTNNFTGITTAASLSATNLTTTGSISGGNIYGTALYLFGNSSAAFAYASGSGGGDNAFLGFSGIFTSKFSPGDFNTAVGFGALNSNGGCCGPNVASNNTATGSSALLANTTGASNTASGYGALYHNTTGSNNTAVGYNAGSPSVYEDTTGSNNTFLGAGSGPGTQPALNYATAIGANAAVGQSNSLVLGSIVNMNGCTSPCASTSVGIGTATPQFTLDVEAPSLTPPPTVNFGSASIPAAFTVNGTTTIAGNLTVTGTCTGCGGSGGGGGTITGVTAGTGLSGGGTSGNVTLSLNTSAANTFTGTQTFNVNSGNGIVASTTSSAGAAVVGINSANGLAGSFQGNVAVIGTTTITGSLNVTGAVTCGSGCSGAPGPGGPGLRETRAALLQWYNQTYTVGSNPDGVAFDGTNIWVTNQGSNTVTKLQASTGGVVGTYSVGSNPAAVAFDGTNIWVTNAGSQSVTKLLASTGATVGTYPVGSNPLGVAFDGTNIWVTNAGSSTVTRLQASTGSVVGTTPVGTNPVGVAFDGTNIWVANQGSNTVTKLQASTGGVVGTYTVGNAPNGVAFDGTNIWVTNVGGSTGTVTELLASTGATVGTYTGFSTALAVAFDGTNIWVTNAGSNNVTKLLASTGGVVSTYTVGSSPGGVAFDGTHIWVTNAGSATVTRIPGN